MDDFFHEIFQSLVKRGYTKFKALPDESSVTRWFRHGVIDDYVTKNIAYHKETKTLVDCVAIEGDDGTLKGIKSKCVKFFRIDS